MCDLLDGLFKQVTGFTCEGYIGSETDKNQHEDQRVVYEGKASQCKERKPIYVQCNNLERSKNQWFLQLDK